MSHLIIFLAIGVLLVVLLLLWALRTKNSTASSEASAEVLPIGELQRSRRILVDRIFAKQDWDFVSSEARPEVQAFFLQERSRVAICWLSQTRKQAAQLMEFHRRAVRQNIELKPAVEMKLAANYLVFLLLCGVLHALIRARGPFRARKMVGYALGVADELWVISEQLLAGIDPARRDKIHAAWPHKSA